MAALFSDDDGFPTDLYFIGVKDSLVWTYSPIGEASWQLSRLAVCQKSTTKFILRHCKTVMAWILEDASSNSKRTVIGNPVPEDSNAENHFQPPLDFWKIWGDSYRLVDRIPEGPDPPALPLVVEAPFASLRYTENSGVARMDLQMRPKAITDEGLEEILSDVGRILRNLAQRPSMVIFFHTDVREACLPAFRHVRRLLAFMQEVGPEFVLVGRGSAIVVNATGILASALLALIRMVQKMLPPPWPEKLVNSSEEAEEFLLSLTSDHLACSPTHAGACSPTHAGVGSGTVKQESTSCPPPDDDLGDYARGWDEDDEYGDIGFSGRILSERYGTVQAANALAACTRYQRVFDQNGLMDVSFEIHPNDDTIDLGPTVTDQIPQVSCCLTPGSNFFSLCLNVTDNDVSL